MRHLKIQFKHTRFVFFRPIIQTGLHAFLFLVSVQLGCSTPSNIRSPEPLSPSAQVFSNSVPFQPTTKSPRIILISVDGLRSDLVPFFSEFSQMGATATGVVPVYPSLTYPNHTTMITGVKPSEHGIINNTVFDENKSGVTTDWYWFADQIKVPTLWDYVARQNERTVSIRWPVSVAAKNLYASIPEVFYKDGLPTLEDFSLARSFTPPDVWTVAFPDTDPSSVIGFERSDDVARKAVNRLIETYQPHLVLMHLSNLDFIQHLYGRKSEGFYAAIQEMKSGIQNLILQNDLTKTCVIITGDHGFYDVSKKVRLELPKQPVDKVIWVHGVGGHAAFYSHDREYLLSTVKTLLKSYPNVLQESPTVNTSTEIFSLSLSLREGYTFTKDTLSPNFSDKPTLEIEPLVRTMGQHGHLANESTPKMQSAFMAFGCGIEPGQNLGTLHMTQIAPTIYSWLGLTEPPANWEQPISIRKSK